jgi:hypothetical protein
MSLHEKEMLNNWGTNRGKLDNNTSWNRNNPNKRNNNFVKKVIDKLKMSIRNPFSLFLQKRPSFSVLLLLKTRPRPMLTTMIALSLSSKLMSPFISYR